MLLTGTPFGLTHLFCCLIIFTVSGHCRTTIMIFSLRWRLIKSYFSRQCQDKYKGFRSASKLSKGEQAVWQRRFWEHQIRDEKDFEAHCNYIHYNPVKHSLVTLPRDWAYSSFHRYVKQLCKTGHLQERLGSGL